MVNRKIISATPGEALGQSDAFIAFQEQLSLVAGVDRPVFLVGERGTGKELAAARLHYLSRRWEAPIIALNCATLSSTLLESELFGHEAGAFTGARERRKGRFEAADGGTLFLDEIGLIPIEVQEKILRVVEYGAFERVGSSFPITVDVRIIGATNADLPQLAKEGKFKRDLLDRLSFEVLFLPPLRERHEDIILLARHFAGRMALELGYKDLPEFSDRAIRLLESYPWPGNVRELKNVVERALYKSQGRPIESIEFDPFRTPYSTASVESTVEIQNPATDDGSALSFPELGEKPLPELIREIELKALRQALLTARYHQGKAANLLGLSYHQFRALYRKHSNALQETS